MRARKPPFKLVAPRIPEAAIQQQITRILTLELAAPGRISVHGVTWWAVDIANFGGKVPGLRTTRGIVAGVPDLLVLYRGKGHFVELKAKDGVLSGAQCDFGAAIMLAGAHFGVARSVEEVLDLLDAWEIPRARRVILPGQSRG